MQLKQMEINNNTMRTDTSSSDPASFQQYNFQYYEQYKRLYQTAFLLSLQLKQLAKSKQQIENKLTKIEKKNQDFKDDLKGVNAAEKKKRFRRTAQTIQRKFICQVERCQKCYGSDGSLQQHIKLKHPQLYQSKSQYRRQNNQDQQQQMESYENQQDNSQEQS